MNTLLAKPPVVVAAMATKPTVARMPLLRARNLFKQFDGRTVLAGIDLDLGPGEIVAVVGRSGCGKSTLLRLLAGLERASGGDLTLAGQHLTGLNHAARLMFQDACLLPWKTVLQNVLLATPEPERLREARKALSRVALLNRADEWPTTLSGGQRQRVALARALASNPPLLFLDEPLGALDALTRLEMQTLLENLWLEKRFGALLITHDVEEAVALGDRVLVMEAGRFTLDIPVDLPRPRDRNGREFIVLKEQALHQLLTRSSQ